MEILLTSKGSWFLLLLIAGVLIGCFFLLGFLDRILQVLTMEHQVRARIRSGLRSIRILYEPLAVLTFGISLLWVKPVPIGLAVLVLSLLLVGQWRDYFAGRLVFLRRSLQEGDEILLKGHRGEVVRMGRLGILLRSNQGLSRWGYFKLLDSEYVMTSGSESGEFYTLLMSREAAGDADPQNLLGDLVTAPYVDWAFRPELKPGPEPNTTLARLQLRDESHLEELIGLLKELGYRCTPFSHPNLELN